MNAREIAEQILSVEKTEGDYLHDLVVTYKVPELAKAYLDSLARIEKLERVVDAIKKCNPRMRSVGSGLDTKMNYTIGIAEMRGIHEALAALDDGGGG